MFSVCVYFILFETHRSQAMKEFNVTQPILYNQPHCWYVSQTTIYRARVHNDKMTGKKNSENHFLHITWQYVGFCVAMCVGGRSDGWYTTRVRDQKHRTRDLSYVLP